MFLEHSNQVASWVERLGLPGPDPGLSAMRNIKNESMLFDNHQVSCSHSGKKQINIAKENGWRSLNRGPHSICFTHINIDIKGLLETQTPVRWLLAVGRCMGVGRVKKRS